MWVVLLAEDEKGDKEGMIEREQRQMELSTFSAKGLTQPKTMKLQGKIGERKVLVLIDSGASHNFIEKGLAAKLGLGIIATNPYQVSLGDGQQNRTNGCCEKVLLTLE